MKFKYSIVFLFILSIFCQAQETKPLAGIDSIPEIILSKIIQTNTGKPLKFAVIPFYGPTKNLGKKGEYLAVQISEKLNTSGKIQAIDPILIIQQIEAFKARNRMTLTSLAGDLKIAFNIDYILTGYLPAPTDLSGKITCQILDPATSTMISTFYVTDQDESLKSALKKDEFSIASGLRFSQYHEDPGVGSMARTFNPTLSLMFQFSDVMEMGFAVFGKISAPLYKQTSLEKWGDVQDNFFNRNNLDIKICTGPQLFEGRMVPYAGWVYSIMNQTRFNFINLAYSMSPGVEGDVTEKNIYQAVAGGLRIEFPYFKGWKFRTDTSGYYPFSHTVKNSMAPDLVIDKITMWGVHQEIQIMNKMSGKLNFGAGLSGDFAMWANSDIVTDPVAGIAAMYPKGYDLSVELYFMTTYIINGTASKNRTATSLVKDRLFRFGGLFIASGAGFLIAGAVTDIERSNVKKSYQTTTDVAKAEKYGNQLDTLNNSIDSSRRNATLGLMIGTQLILTSILDHYLPPGSPIEANMKIGSYGLDLSFQKKI